MSEISEFAFALIIAEGQLEEELKAERRWRMRKLEAQKHELDARDRVINYQRIIENLKRGICRDGYNSVGNQGTTAAMASTGRYA